MAVYIVIGFTTGKGETVLKIFRTLSDAMMYKSYCMKTRNTEYEKFIVKIRHL